MNLRRCIKKLGLSKHEAAIMRSIMGKHDDGTRPQTEAAKMAVQEQLADLRDEKASIERQIEDQLGRGEQAQRMIGEASKTAAHSAENDIPLPTQAQIEAGNYPKGHVRLLGFDITIENPKGSTRSGVGPDGPWQIKMQTPYGYIRRTEGADGEQVDVYLGPNITEEAPVFIIDQIDPKTKMFDEHKVILGALGYREAKNIYDDAFADDSGEKRRGAIKMVSLDEFRRWLSTNDVSPYQYKEPRHTVRNDPFLQSIKDYGGINIAYAEGVTSEKAFRANALFPGLFRKQVQNSKGVIVQGHGLDEIARMAIADKWMAPDDDLNDGGVTEVTKKIQRHLRGDFEPKLGNEDEQYARMREKWEEQQEAMRRREELGAGFTEQEQEDADELDAAVDFDQPTPGQWLKMSQEEQNAELDRILGSTPSAPVGEAPAQRAAGQGGGTTQEEGKAGEGEGPSEVAEPLATTSFVDRRNAQLANADFVSQYKGYHIERSIKEGLNGKVYTADIFEPNNGPFLATVSAPTEHTLASRIQAKIDGQAEQKRGPYNPNQAEQKRLPYNPNQAELVYDNIPTRPGTTDKQKSEGIAALKALSLGMRRRGATILGSRLWKNFTERGGAELLGQRVENAADLGTLAQILRDPRYETMRVFFVKNNVLVDHVAWTSRMPGAVSFVIEGRVPEETGEAVMQRLGQLGARMDAVGADGYWLMHNHPSGLSEPSDADIALTQNIKRFLYGYKGHVVIDHNEFSEIGLDGETVRKYEFKGPPDPEAEVPHMLLGRRLYNNTDLAAIAREFEKRKDWVTVIATTAANQVQAIAEIPKQFLKYSTPREQALVQARIQHFMRATGAGGRTVIVTNDVIAVRNLVDDDIVTIITDGKVALATPNQPQMHSKAVWEARENSTMYVPFRSAVDLMNDFTRSDRKLNRVISKVNTPFHIAETLPEFKPVYDEAQSFQYDVGRITKESADLAPDLLVTIEHFKDFGKKPPSNADVTRVQEVLNLGTLFGGGSPLEGRVWTDQELKTGRLEGKNLKMFEPLTPAQIKLYRQALASVEHSVKENAKSMMWRLAAQQGFSLDPGMAMDQMAQDARDKIDRKIEEANIRLQRATTENKKQDAAVIDREIGQYQALKKAIDDVEEKTIGLVEHGYFPLMRFGQYWVNVDVTDAAGKRELFFGRYESQRDQNQAIKELKAEYPNANVTSGIMNDQMHKLFQGLSMDALELFADYVEIRDREGNVISDEAKQAFLRMATTDRSMMKRHIHRKGVPGFSKDVIRVLASFTTSAARNTSSQYHGASMLRKVSDIRSGDLQEYATNFVRYVNDPAEEAQALRGFLANYYILGSLAFGAVNMTQPLTMTAPALSAHTSWTNAMRQIIRASTEYATGLKKLTQGERMAYERASKEGIVSPQEVHQIRAETRGSLLGDSALYRALDRMGERLGVPVPSRITLRKLSFLWGSIYSLTEQFNRSTTFLAAYRIGVQNKVADPYAFARNQVEATQGVYNKANRPVISRGVIGAPVMTFKQFSIAYVELAKRLYSQDKKSFAIMMATLMVLAGMQGLPFAEDAEDLIDTIGQWLGYGTNSKKKVRQLVIDLLGPEIGNTLLYGVSAIPGVPIDVAQRLGTHNLIPGTAIMKASETDKTRDIQEVLGPAAGLAKNVATAVEGLATGKPSNVKFALPTALQNVAKAWEMGTTGQYRDAGGRKIQDVGPVDVAAKAIGFQPAKIAKETRVIMLNQQDIALQRVMEDSIAAEIARGMLERDRGAVNAGRERLREWNETNPELRIQLTPAQIARRIREMSRSREERFLRSAPREIRPQLRQELTP